MSDRIFARAGKDYLACRAAVKHGCSNIVRPRMFQLEAQVLDALAQQLMQPAQIEAFIATFNRTCAEARVKRRGSANANGREPKLVEKKISNLIDALAEGMRTPDLRQLLDELEQRRGDLASKIAATSAPPLTLPPNLAKAYQEKVTRLRSSLVGPDNTAALEDARSLIPSAVALIALHVDKHRCRGLRRAISPVP